jgi:hypothetical protein
LLAEGTLQLELKPVVDTLAVELVHALETLHHLPPLQLVDTDRTVYVLALVFVFEGSVRVYNISDLFGAELALLVIIICELLLAILFVFFLLSRVLVLRVVGRREGKLLIPPILIGGLVLELVWVHPLEIHIHVELLREVVHYLGEVLEDVSEIRGLKSLEVLPSEIHVELVILSVDSGLLLLLLILLLISVGLSIAGVSLRRLLLA